MNLEERVEMLEKKIADLEVQVQSQQEASEGLDGIIKSIHFSPIR